MHTHTHTHTHTHGQTNTREDVWKVGLQQLTHLVLTLAYDIAITLMRLSLSQELSVRGESRRKEIREVERWKERTRERDGFAL